MPIMERVRRRAPAWADRLERVIEVVSPRAALERKAWRVAGEQLAGFKGGKKNRVRGDIPTGGRADFHLSQNRWETIEIGRKLERDSVIGSSLLSRSVENIVGPGFNLNAGTRSPAWNKRAEKLWRGWAAGPCDARGLSDLSELLRLTCRARLRDGDHGTILLSDGSLQQVEADQIVSPDRSAVPRKNMVDGVELDRRGRPVAFHVVDDPDPILGTVRFGNKTTAIPTESFVFTAYRERHGQTRGVGRLPKLGWLIDQVDGNIEAVTIASRMAACVGLVLHKQRRMSGLEEDDDGHRRLKMQPGFVLEVGQDDKATTITPNQPGQSWPDYLATLFRLAGLEFGLPLELAFLDVSRANYTNLRAAFLQAQRTWRIEQAALMAWLSTIYRWKILNWIREGKLPARSDAFEHSWIAFPWPWVDPEKEFRAAQALIDAGLSTKRRTAALRGDDYDLLREERAKEIQGDAAAGLPEVRSPLTRDPVSMSAEAEDGDAPDDPAPEPEED